MAPYNDNAMREIVSDNAMDLAGIIIGPFSAVPRQNPDPEGAPHVRGRHAIDEVVMFRLAYGGAQEYGVVRTWLLMARLWAADIPSVCSLVGQILWSGSANTGSVVMIMFGWLPP